MVKIWNDNKIQPTLKKPTMLEMWNLKILDSFQNMSHVFKFSKTITTCKWGVMYMAYTMRNRMICN
jgi:hypothetical protein